jgi:hypothetical protein
VLSPIEDERLDKVRRCLRTDEGKELIAYLSDRLQRHHAQLKSSREILDIYRYQGRIEECETILKLREE